MVNTANNVFSFWPLVLLASASWLSALILPHREVKGHFSFFTKLVLGFSVAAFASDLIIYFVSGRSTSLSSATGSYGGNSTTPQINVSGSSGGMPWDGILEDIYEDLAKYVVIVVGGIAFIIAGLSFMWGDGSGTMRLGRRNKTFTANEDAVKRGQWETELQALVAQGFSSDDNQALSEVNGWRKIFRHMTPKLVVLPKWWPFHGYGAWSYMRYVIISRELFENATSPVQAYVLGHECGHIRYGHTALNYMYPVTSLLFFAALYLFETGNPHTQFLAALALAALLIPKSALLWFPSRREFQADQFAASLIGEKEAVAGSLWMARNGRDFSKARQQRLLRLGANISDISSNTNAVCAE